MPATESSILLPSRTMPDCPEKSRRAQGTRTSPSSSPRERGALLGAERADLWEASTASHSMAGGPRANRPTGNPSAKGSWRTGALRPDDRSGRPLTLSELRRGRFERAQRGREGRRAAPTIRCLVCRAKEPQSVMTAGAPALSRTRAPRSPPRGIWSPSSRSRWTAHPALGAGLRGRRTLRRGSRDLVLGSPSRRHRTPGPAVPA
jgi:hypothetical protein